MEGNGESEAAGYKATWLTTLSAQQEELRNTENIRLAVKIEPCAIWCSRFTQNSQYAIPDANSSTKAQIFAEIEFCMHCGPVSPGAEWGSRKQQRVWPDIRYAGFPPGAAGQKQSGLHLLPPLPLPVYTLRHHFSAIKHKGKVSNQISH